MESVSDYLQYLLKFIASEVSPRKALGILVLIICFFLLRWTWRRGVKEFKRGMLSSEETRPKNIPSHAKEPTAVKTKWETQFVRFCRASGLAIRRTAKEWKTSKHPPRTP
ncbi:MAG TPA: hypothetical protein VMC85_03665 [Desulfomonilaceae bacterium]|nr:hypothetical protein [Desulfomonilaceae bacterium]